MLGIDHVTFFAKAKHDSLSQCCFYQFSSAADISCMNNSINFHLIYWPKYS